MKNKIFRQNGLIYLLLFSITAGLFLMQCSKDKEPEDCNTRTKRDQYFGYEVWAGDSALWGVQPDWSDYDPMVYYNIDKYYTLIGSSTTTKTFNTGNYKYYVIAARWYCCIDAIQFADSSYYEAHMVVDGNPVTTIGGLAEHPPYGGIPAGDSARFLGAPDGISGNLGYIDLCKEPAAFGGFLTDNATIIARGGGLTVYVVHNCTE
jgi:hypothetical protein